MELIIRQMQTGDIPLGMQLKEQAGWNQTIGDWRRFLGFEPEGCFVAEQDGHPVATTTTCVFGSVAWIAMVLVNKDYRHQGIGTRMMHHAVGYLDRRGVTTIRLDATPLGRPVYERMGFLAEHQLVRLEGTARGQTADAGAVPVSSSVAKSLLDLDRRASGTDRGRLIERLLAESPEEASCVTSEATVQGFVMLRPGARATQIGPAAATNPDAGRALGDWALNQCAGRLVFADIPLQNRPAIEWASARGLTEQRRLTRMFRGAPVSEQVDLLWASSGPEKG